VNQLFTQFCEQTGEKADSPKTHNTKIDQSVPETSQQRRRQLASKKGSTTGRLASIRAKMSKITARKQPLRDGQGVFSSSCGVVNLSARKKRPLNDIDAEGTPTKRSNLSVA